MTMTAQSVIQAMVQAAETEPEKATESKPVITISRTMGSGGNEVARLLADRLGTACYCAEVLDAVAKQTQVNTSLMNRLHESVASASDAWLYSLAFGKDVTRDAYQRHLVTAIRALYRVGGVIVGRAAHLILAGRDVLRVRIIGSPEACAKRIAMQEGIEITEARRRVKESNRKRDRFVREQFSRNANDPLDFDLVINTDTFASHDRVVDLIEFTLGAMAESGKVTGTTRK